MNKKFKVVTLGCRTNQYESQAYCDQLLALGYAEAKEGEEAELCIVNTCTVTEGADSSSRHEIRGLARKHPHAQIVVTGCLAERVPSEMQALPQVSHVVSNKDKEQLLSVVFPEMQWPEFSIKRFGDHTRAFLKVQDGCNSFCTYCILPYVRGRSRSRPLQEIVDEAKGLIASGHKEIVITGINVGDFDGAPKAGERPLRLVDLVKAIDGLPGLERLRISSIDPDEVDDALLSAVLQGKTTCHSMHIVLQSGSNVILKRMNRKYTREIFLEAIDRIRKQSGDFTFTTDIIVGFPGESDRDFQDSVDMMEYVRFAKVHMFPYSPRERTRAALYPNRVAAQVMNARRQQMLHLAEKHAFALRGRYVGRTMRVLFENAREQERFITGHTENFLPVFVEKHNLRANDLCDVEILSNQPEGLFGRALP
ncbi:MAG TPA: tRNA (N(6)-L-threonylcarbamoyladenosine(37)-C(2))-methylthiotransferase MtaB [Rhabdochlamydiaceae bacterium]